MMTALEAGAEDFSAEEGIYEILTDPSDFSQVREALEEAGYRFLSAETDKIPQTTVQLTPEQQESVFAMLDMLDDNDDVQNVYHNAQLDEE